MSAIKQAISALNTRGMAEGIAVRIEYSPCEETHRMECPFTVKNYLMSGLVVIKNKKRKQ